MVSCSPRYRRAVFGAKRAAGGERGPHRMFRARHGALVRAAHSVTRCTPVNWWLVAEQADGSTGKSSSPSDGEGRASGGSAAAGVRSGTFVQARFSTAGIL